MRNRRSPEPDSRPAAAITDQHGAGHQRLVGSMAGALAVPMAKEARMVFCSQCGTRVPQDARFCEECGAGLPAGRLAVAHPQPSVAGVTAYQVQTAPPAQATMSPVTGAGQVINFNPTINVSVASPQQTPASQLLVARSADVPLVLRILWFLCVGVWFGLLWITVAWLLNLTLIGLPLGLAMLNRVPQVMTLQSTSSHTAIMMSGPATIVTVGGQPRQLPFPIRALYFLGIGIWLSLIWSILAWVAAVTLIGLPLSFWMFNRVPMVTTLRIN